MQSLLGIQRATLTIAYTGIKEKGTVKNGLYAC
jgi:hypothetical protein